LKEFALTDWLVFIGYSAIIIIIGLWVSRSKKGEEKTAILFEYLIF
jgi:Na+/proline symporter